MIKYSATNTASDTFAYNQLDGGAPLGWFPDGSRGPMWNNSLGNVGVVVGAADFDLNGTTEYYHSGRLHRAGVGEFLPGLVLSVAAGLR